MPAGRFHKPCARDETTAFLGKRGIFEAASVTPHIFGTGPHGQINRGADNHPARHILAASCRIGGHPNPAGAPPVQQNVSGKLIGYDDLGRCQCANGITNANHHRIKHLTGTPQRHLRPQDDGKIDNLRSFGIEDGAHLGGGHGGKRLCCNILALRHRHGGQQRRQLRRITILGRKLLVIQAHASSSSRCRSATSIRRRAI